MLHDHEGWFITFKSPDAAKRAARVLSIGQRMLANRSVTITVHPPPQSADEARSGPAAGKRDEDERKWSRPELVEEAEKAIVSELRQLLEKDVLERVRPCCVVCSSKTFTMEGRYA